MQALLQTVTDAATEVSGAQFWSFFYNTADPSGDANMLYTVSGVPRSAFDGFDQPRAAPLFEATFRDSVPVRCADVLQDSRYGKMNPYHGMPGHPPVRSYLAVPVISRTGKVIGGLFFGHAATGIFTERSERIVVGIAAQAAVAIDNAQLYEATQRAAAEREQLLDSERSARVDSREKYSVRARVNSDCWRRVHEMDGHLFSRVHLDSGEQSAFP